VLTGLIQVRVPYFIEAFSLITVLGDWQVIAIGLAIAIVVFALVGKKKYILPLLISAGGSATVAYIGKLLVQRPRPDALPSIVEQGFAFPSAHAAIAIGFYGFIMFFLMRNISNWALKINVFFIGIFLIAAIGFSRVYLGVHYLTDVLGGYLAGVLWLLVAINVYRWLDARNPKH